MNRFHSGVLASAMCVSVLSEASAAGFKLSSSDVRAGQRIPNAQVLQGFGCSGDNRSPALSWSGAPAHTRSYAVTLYDPDAPTGSGFWHWVVYNIPASVKRLPSGAGDALKSRLPAAAVQGLTDFGQHGYGGPCPPAGDAAHRYIFTVYALDQAEIDMPSSSTPAFVGFNLHGHTLARATLTARYGR